MLSLSLSSIITAFDFFIILLFSFESVKRPKHARSQYNPCAIVYGKLHYKIIIRNRHRTWLVFMPFELCGMTGRQQTIICLKFILFSYVENDPCLMIDAEWHYIIVIGIQSISRILCVFQAICELLLLLYFFFVNDCRRNEIKRK